jgi:hypothetical protein
MIARTRGPVLTSPLEGEVDRIAVGRGVTLAYAATPLPIPPPQGGREEQAVVPIASKLRRVWDG